MLIKGKIYNKAGRSIVRNLFCYRYVKIITLLVGFTTYTYAVYSMAAIDKTLIKEIIPFHLRQSIKDTVPYQVIESGFKVNTPLNYIKGISTPAEVISLDIKYINLEKLQQKRRDALKAGILIASENDYVNATVSNSTKKVPAKIRLKGDWTDHLVGNKWSYRVKLDKGETLYGMNKFSLQAPRTRNYFGELLFHELLKLEGLPSLKYFFTPLKVNGDNLGVYAIEQHFDKILLESNKYKEGPILKLSEAVSWEKIYRVRQAYNDINKFDTTLFGSSLEQTFYETEVDLFKKNKIFKNPILTKQYKKAAQLLYSLYVGSLKTSEVYDIDKLARFFAIADLTGAKHALHWHNLRSYYDPTISKLIPIGFDGFGGLPLKELSIVFVAEKEPNIRFFDDPKFARKYVANLERISAKSYLDDFYSDSREVLNHNANIMYRSFPAKSLKKEILYSNQNLIKEALAPPSPINVYLQSQDNTSVTLAIGNKQIFPIEVLGIYIKDKPLYVPESIVQIPSKFKDEYPIYKEYSMLSSNAIELDLTKSSNDISVVYRLSGSSQSRRLPLIPYSRHNASDAKKDLIRSKGNVEEFNFIAHDYENRKITFKPGNWVIDKPLIIPNNYTVIGTKGLRITLQGDGLIFSNSALQLKGDASDPIIISADHGAGLDIGGRGLVVINAKKTSNLEHVVFKGLSSPMHKSWSVPGAVTFYQSPVRLNQCNFRSNNSEDSLNIIRTNFTIKNCDFLNSKSDAIDIDFSSGTLENVSIYSSRGDGLDISGSKVYANLIKIVNAEDKGISVGESSELTAKNITVIDTNLSIASKDNSSIKANNVNLSSSNYGLAVFQKKEEYGPATLTINNLEYENINELYLLENPSKLVIDSQLYSHNSSNIREKLYAK